MSRFAIRTPYLVVVLCLVVAILGGVSVLRMPVDMFPAMNIPVVVVATFYSGMPPEQIESGITSRYERFFTLASNIDHIESRSIAGVSVIKVYFQPGADADSAVTAISNLSMANLRRLPPGTLPPLVLKFDASSLPVCLITLKGKGLTETALRDLAQYNIRNQVAGAPGASVPQPFGGVTRQIMLYADPFKLESRQLSPMDVVRGINDANLILPAANVQIGQLDYNIYTNSLLPSVTQIDDVPLKMIGQSPVRVRDIGTTKDAARYQRNVVRVDGQRSVYLPVLKQGGDTNAIAVVDGVRRVVDKLVDIPEQLESKVVFDQSEFVKTAIETLLHEGAIGLFLTSLLILLFLGSLRATVAVLFSIPLSALATMFALYLGGSSINSMVLGGLALAFSRLIDNSVVVLENIYRHLEMGESPEVAAEKGGQEVALPVLAATLTTVIVFFPVTFLYGVSKFLFTALGLAVAISLFASYAVALTVVPLFCARFIKSPASSHTAALPRRAWGRRFNRSFNQLFEKLLRNYDSLITRVLRHPVAVLTISLFVFLSSLLLYPKLDLAFFPRTESRQFLINVKAPSGTRISVSEVEIAKVEQVIREEVAPSDLGMIVSNIGLQSDFSAMYTTNSAGHTAFIQVSLQKGHRTGSYEYMQRVKTRLSRQMPHLTAYFQSGGMVDAVLNLGLPAPIDVQVSGSNLANDLKVANELADRIRSIPNVADIFIPQDLDYPSLQMDIDRTRASELGLSQKEIMSNVITSLTSNTMIAPGYWLDPRTGNDYLLTVQYPEGQIKTIQDLLSIPLRASDRKNPTRLDSVATIQRFNAPTEVDHYQLRRTIDVYVRPMGEDLGRIASSIDSLLEETRLPKGVTVTLRGMVQGMRSSFYSFGVGLSLAIVLLYLVLVAQFRSFVDPLIILLAVPPGLTGVLLTLYYTNTSMNVMSLMGVVMLVGIAVSNSILIVEFTRHLRQQGSVVHEAVSTACRVRLRPVLMTSLATIIGLMPMALKMGTGSESYAPLARAIIGGLTLSVILTVVLVPAAYYLVHRRHDQDHAYQPAESAS